MKKAISLVLALMLTFALCACGESSDSDTDIVNYYLNGDIQKIAHSTDEKEGGESSAGSGLMIQKSTIPCFGIRMTTQTISFT